MLDVGLAGKAIAGLALGLGLLWFIIKKVNQGQADQIEKLSGQAYIKQTEQNKVIEEQIKKDVETAKSKSDSAPVTDW
jgi:hypothetical protein